jgi:putative peptidoglycan lipid II flippase
MRTSRAAFLVAAGILLSRISGLVRDRVFAHYFGNSDAADAFRAAFRIPNFLQNLFGEGVLSASFIPVYARLLAEKRDEDADRVAGAILSLLTLVTAVLVLLGVLATPWLIGAIAPGFSGEKRALTITLVRIFFPGAGLLVISAWCLGILNSHRRFFISYAVGVVANAAIIVGLIAASFRTHEQPHLAVYTAWASVVGSALQVVFQMPIVLRLARGLKISTNWRGEHLRTIVRNFVPVFFSRGVVQISAYIDSLIASFLPTGAVAALAYAQTLYTLPVSLFGMSVSAAELPAMSSALGTEEEVAAQLRERLTSAMRQIAYFVIPSVIAFLALGDVIVGAIYQTGRFTRDDTVFVWTVLAGSAVGLLASTLARLYASTFYALRDTRTPLRFAIVRVVLTTVLGYLAAIPLPQWLHIAPRWGVAGLTASAGLAGWVEFVLLRSAADKRIGTHAALGSHLAKLWGCAIVAGTPALLLNLYLTGLTWWATLPKPLRDLRPVLTAIVVLGVYGIGYLGLTTVIGVPEARSALRRLRR